VSLRERHITVTGWLPRLVARVPATVHAKLLVSFLAIAALLIVMGIVGLHVLSGVNDRAEELVKLQQKIAAYRQIQRDVSLPSSWTWNERTLEAARSQLNQFRHDFDRLPSVPPEEAAALARIREEQDALATALDELFNLTRTGQAAAAREFQLAQASPIAENLERLTNEAVNKAEVDMAVRIQATQDAYRTSRWVVIGFAGGSLALALTLGYAMSWSLIGPVTLMHARLRLVASGDFSQRVEVPNRDELGALTRQFNQMAAQLDDSYATLQDRTRELSESLDQQTATSDILRLFSRSPTDVQPVFEAIVTNGARLCGGEQCLLVGLEGGALIRLASHNFHPEGEVSLRALFPAPLTRSYTSGRAILERQTVHVPDIAADPEYGPKHLAAMVGYRAAIGIPLIRESRPIGALVVTRESVGRFSPRQVDLLQTFADQAVMAIENARLFQETADKSRQLEAASRHKSEFLASMSHELRTPLNAILGFNEMILGEVYGEVPPDLKEPLTDIMNSGKHLLRLINNVLDLSKIEAGRMDLALDDYSVQDTVERVRASLHPLAVDKGLDFVVSVPEGLPLAYGDAGRVAQCLTNLAGNALKFTRRGRVEIGVERQGDLLVYRVADTGIGMAPDRLATVFDEFRQADATIASEFGGTGLGLSITKKFVEMHGGRIWVESELGKGSTFLFSVPLRVAEGQTP
jgi:signal transduction histidine kinase/CHASE3 domain sensor protein